MEDPATASEVGAASETAAETADSDAPRTASEAEAAAHSAPELESILSETEPPQPATEAPTDASKLRFSEIAAGRDRFCGLTAPEAALACVSGATITEYRPGPFQSLSLTEEQPGLHNLCLITESGSITCDAGSELVPVGTFH